MNDEQSHTRPASPQQQPVSIIGNSDSKMPLYNTAVKYWKLIWIRKKQVRVFSFSLTSSQRSVSALPSFPRKKPLTSHPGTLINCAAFPPCGSATFTLSLWFHRLYILFSCLHTNGPKMSIETCQIHVDRYNLLIVEVIVIILLRAISKKHCCYLIQNIPMEI